MFEIGDKVSFYRMNYFNGMNELFEGIIVNIEFKDSILTENRYGLKIENNPFPFPVPYFFEKELKKVLDKWWNSM